MSAKKADAMGRRKLLTETDTAAVKAKVIAAAKAALGLKRGHAAATFEHGQWWITDTVTGAQWSVCDASGPGSTDGFDFEQVTTGEEV